MYSDVFCKVYNEFGWNYYPEIFGEQLLTWLERHNVKPANAMDLACGTGVLCELLHKAGIKAGIAVNPETDLSAIENYLDKVDMVLVMSVHPGYGGQSYIEDVNPKISELRKRMGDDFHIQVDGGINLSNIAEVNKLGADVLVAGSAVFGGDIEKSVKGLLDAVK